MKKIFSLLIFILLCSIGSAQPMLFGDTSRTGVPFSKDPHVVKFEGRYLMYFSIPPYKNNPSSGWNIGIATSKDGIHWERISTEPFLRNGAEGEWNSSESGHPHIFTDEDGRTYLFYQGNNSKGKHWYLSQKEVLWRGKKPYLKE